MRPASTPFDAQTFLDSAGVARRVATYRTAAIIYSQGDVSDGVMYVQKGEVKLSVVSKAGREAVIAMIGPGRFFGEGGLAGQPLRMGSATANAPSTVLVIEKQEMLRLLHAEHALSDRFIGHLLTRNIHIEEDLVDQLFNSTEKRLARALLLLARYGEQDTPRRTIPRIPKKTLAEMVGTTSSRVTFFMNRFRKRGFIETNGGLTIHRALLSVVLSD
jgi:CRP/FNR family cyclic AMP-dependent transcriptional regulator